MPPLIVPGACTSVIRFTVSNNDTDEAIVIDSVTVEFIGVAGLGFSATTDLDSVGIFNPTSGLLTRVTVTGNLVTIPLTGRADTRVAPSTVSNAFEVVVCARATSDGGRFTVEVNSANVGGGVLFTDTGNSTVPSPTHSLTTTQITIPVITFNDADVTNTQFFISPNSDIHPIVGIRLGAVSQTPPLEFSSITLRFRNIRNFIPGGGVTDDCGDLEHLYIIKDGGDGSFGATGNRDPSGSPDINLGTEVLGNRVNRVALGATTPAGGCAALSDSYTITLVVDDEGPSSSNDIPDLTALPVAQSGTSFRGSTFWVAIETNRRFSDDPSLNGVGPGDAWRAEVVQIVTDFGTFLSGFQTDTITEVMEQTDTANIIVPIHLSGETSDLQPGGTPPGSQDGRGLDFLEFTPIFGFHMLGGDTFNNNDPPKVQRIVLEILDPTGTLDLTSALSPLRPINNTRLSGIQLRKNRDGGGSAIHALENADGIVAIDQSLTTYQNGTGIDTLTLVFTPDQLSLEHVKPEKNSSGDPLTNNWTDTVVSASSGNLLPFNNDYFLGVLASDRARFGDTLVFRIPPQGIVFSNGTRSDTFFGRPISKVLFAPPVLPSNLVSSGQVVGESSPPTPLIRFQIGSANRGERLERVYVYLIDTSPTGVPQLSQSDLLDHNADGVPFTNVTEANGASLSGLAIYRDRNGNGLFELGTDSFVPFLPASIGALDGTRFIPLGADVNLLGGLGGLHGRMIFDTSSGLTSFATGDTGVFFVCVRSSGTIDPNDLFFAVIGDLDAVEQNGEYVDAEASGIWVRSNLGLAQTYTNQGLLSDGADTYGAVDARDTAFRGVGGWRREDHFRSRPILGEALEKVLVNDLTVPNQTVFAGDRIAAFGLDFEAAPGATVTLDSLAVVVGDTGTFFGDFNPLVDLAAISTGGGSGIAIYRDNGSTNGAFDASDAPAGIVNVDASGLTTSGRVVFNFSPPIAVPTDDSGTNAGNDLFVVLNIGTSITFRDDFVAAIPERAFGFSNNTLKQPNGDTSLVLTAGLPVILSAVGDTFINTDSRPLFVIGIDAADTTFAGDGGIFLLTVRVTFETVTGFSLTDLRSFTNDTFSGIALFRDNGGTNGVFDPTTGANPDGFIPLAAAPSASGLVVTMTIAGSGETVPPLNSGADTGPDFWVVLRASTTCDSTDRFRATIASGGLTWSTIFAPDTTIRSGIIQCTGIVPGRCNITGRNPFSPDGRNNVGAETTSIATSTQVDTSIRIRLIDRAGATVLDTSTIGRSFTVVIDQGVVQSNNFGQGMYRVVVNIDTAGANTADTCSAELAVDTTGYIDSGTVTITAQSGSDFTLTVNLDLTVPSGLSTLRQSFEEAARRAEQNGDTIEIYANGVRVDTIVLTAGQTSAQRVVSITSPSLLTAVLVDAIGNRSETTTIGFANPLGQGDLTVTFEGNAPVFYKSAVNTAFTFTFPAQTGSGAFFEVFNLAGNRVRRQTIPAGVFSADWDGSNDGGTVLRNGVYVLKFHVPLTGGAGTIEERRTIVLMK